MSMKGKQVMNNVKILALFGESGSGKDTIQNWLVENIKNTHKLISYTSRPPRDYEINERDYFFISPKDFSTKLIQDNFLEYSNFNGWFYGTSKDALSNEKINIGVFNPQGVRSLILKSQHNSLLKILPVWIQIDDKTRLLRSLNRENTPNCEEICRRFIADKKDFSNLNFNYEIYLNDNNDFQNILNNLKIKTFLEV